MEDPTVPTELVIYETIYNKWNVVCYSNHMALWEQLHEKIEGAIIMALAYRNLHPKISIRILGD